MADVRPFPAIRYNPTKVTDLSRVVTQPYDKITPKMQEEYYARHPFNFVRLILPKEINPYETSAQVCSEWLKEGILIEEKIPSYYILEEEFTLNNRRMKRRGFIGALRVEEFEKGTVLPHEFTHSKPKEDRLRLLQTTKKDYEQIFLLYSDEKGEVDALLETSTSRPPLIEITDEFGVLHRLWRLDERERMLKINTMMKDKVVLIADGHHRYETALNYREEMEKKGPVPENASLRFKTAAFFNIADPGLVILPTHRVLKGLERSPSEVIKSLESYFTIQQVVDDKAREELEKRKEDHAFVIYLGKGKSYLIILKPLNLAPYFENKAPEYQELDVAILHRLVIEEGFGITPEEIEKKVSYERYWEDATRRVDTDEYDVALFLNPPKTEQVQALARNMERMPQKSTDFYPKLISGLVFMDVSEGRSL